MLEIKYGANLTIPGGPQFTISNQIIQCEVYKHFNIILSADQETEEITLREVKNLNLLAVKATSALAADSPSKLKYKMDAGNFVDLDAPLLLFGEWASYIVTDNLKISFKLEPVPDKKSVKFAKDSIKVEIIVGWSEAS